MKQAIRFRFSGIQAFPVPLQPAHSLRGLTFPPDPIQSVLPSVILMVTANRTWLLQTIAAIPFRYSRTPVSPVPLLLAHSQLRLTSPPEWVQLILLLVTLMVIINRIWLFQTMPVILFRY